MRILPLTQNKPVLRIDKAEFSAENLKKSIMQWGGALKHGFPKLKITDKILVSLPPSLDFVSAFYSILGYKGIFIPVDSNIENENLISLINRHQIKFAITIQPNAHFGSMFSNVIFAEDVLQSFSRDICLHRRKDSAIVIGQFSSGSTGDAKIIFRTYGDLLEECRAVSNRLCIDPGDTLFCPLRLSHSFALTTCLTAAIYRGACFHTISSFSPAYLKNAFTCNTTIFAASPYIYEILLKLLKRKPLTLDSIRLFLSAGAPLALDLIQSFKTETGKDICNLYGSTETGALAVNYPFDNYEPVSVGKPLSHVNIKCKNSRIIIYKKGGETVLQDCAIFSERKNIILSGRSDEQININGKKIDPRIILSLFVKKFKTKEAAIRKILIQGKPILEISYSGTHKYDEKEIFEYCVKHLPPFMVPKKFTYSKKLKKALL